MLMIAIRVSVVMIAGAFSDSVLAVVLLAVDILGLLHIPSWA